MNAAAGVLFVCPVYPLAIKSLTVSDLLQRSLKSDLNIIVGRYFVGFTLYLFIICIRITGTVYLSRSNKYLTLTSEQDVT